MLQTIKRLSEELAGIKRKGNSCIKRAIKRVNTSTPHVHGLHKYKAKFFPRMTRSLMVSVIDSVPRDKNNNVILLDPFVGSGTALAEASLLEVPSKGVDIDKLSCQISNTKIALLNDVSVKDLQQALAELESEDSLSKKLSQEARKYKFPPWIKAKFIRWDSLEEQEEYELEITNIIISLNRVKSPKIGILEVFVNCDRVVTCFSAIAN